MQNDIVWKEYGRWLARYVRMDGRKYKVLIDTLHNIPFIFSIERDANRVDDGLALREEYNDGLTGSTVYFNNPCSVLEVLISLSNRMECEYVGDPRRPRPDLVFYELIGNLGLTSDFFIGNDIYEDPIKSMRASNKIEQIVNKWMDRQFEPNGFGSIFPIKNTKRDQRKIEIWDQMNEYISNFY